MSDARPFVIRGRRDMRALANLVMKRLEMGVPPCEKCGNDDIHSITIDMRLEDHPKDGCLRCGHTRSITEEEVLNAQR